MQRKNWLYVKYKGIDLCVTFWLEKPDKQTPDDVGLIDIIKVEVQETKIDALLGDEDFEEITNLIRKKL